MDVHYPGSGDHGYVADAKQSYWGISYFRGFLHTFNQLELILTDVKYLNLKSFYMLHYQAKCGNQ